MISTLDQRAGGDLNGRGRSTEKIGHDLDAVITGMIERPRGEPTAQTYDKRAVINNQLNRARLKNPQQLKMSAREEYYSCNLNLNAGASTRMRHLSPLLGRS